MGYYQFSAKNFSAIHCLAYWEPGFDARQLLLHRTVGPGPQARSNCFPPNPDGYWTPGQRQARPFHHARDDPIRH